jgi:deazaflavin-dependent oxidoreductase (nitroreductase family)
VGRKSGQLYVTPIAYFYLNGYYFVVASNWGKDANAGWYHNLRANPRVRIDVDGRELDVTARVAQGREYAQLWTHAVERHPPYAEYQKKTKRQIPIVIFEPVK